MQSRFKRLVILIIGALVLILLISVGVKEYGSYSIKHTASSFIDKILTNDATGSYQQFDKKAQAATDPDVWAGQVTQWSNFFKGDKPVYVQTVKNTSYTLVDYNIQGQDGKYLFEVTLVKSGLGQKVQAFGSSLQ